MALTLGTGTTTNAATATVTIGTGRKVINVAVSSGNDGEDSYIVALCDDGTIWRLAYKLASTWEKIDAVPQT